MQSYAFNGQLLVSMGREMNKACQFETELISMIIIYYALRPLSFSFHTKYIWRGQHSKWPLKREKVIRKEHNILSSFVDMNK